MKLTRAQALVAIFIVAVIIILVLFSETIQHWISVHTGVASPDNPVWYNFWSGFGSDLGEVTLVAAIITPVIVTYRHANCHVKGCPRIGKPVSGTPYRACHKHHPAHDGDARNVSVETIHAAHAANKENQ